MAKVKEAKDKITAYLKGKGLDAADIKDVFAELDAADTDLEQLAKATQKNSEWLDWYNKVVPQVQQTMSEYDALKQRMAKLEAAGVTFDTTATAQSGSDIKTPQGYVSLDQLEQFKRELIGATSGTMKGLTKVALKHYRRFGKEPDIDAVEKLMNERDQYNQPKYRDVEEAYRAWSKPMRAEAKEAKYKERLQKGIQEGLQNELSKQGIRAPRTKKADEIDVAPISEVAKSKDDKVPTDRELREAFLNDLDSAASGVLH